MEQDFRPPKDALNLRAYVFKYPKQFWLQAAGGVVYNTVVVFGAIFLGMAIDAADLVYKGEAPVSLFYRNLCAYIGINVVFQVARYFKRYYMRMINNLMSCDIRAGLLSALFDMEMAELNHEKVGDMMSRMIGDVEQVGSSVRRTITEIWDTVLLMISYFVACMAYSPRITLIAAIPIPIVIVLAQAVRTPLYRLSQKARKAAADVNVHLQHNISGITLLRLYGLEKADGRRFSKLLEEQLKWNILSYALQGGVTPLYILFAASGIVFVVGLGGGNVVGGVWTLGMFTAYLSMFTAMAVRTNTVGRVMNTWHGAKASWDRICEKLAADGKQNENDANGRKTHVTALPAVESNMQATAPHTPNATAAEPNIPVVESHTPNMPAVDQFMQATASHTLNVPAIEPQSLATVTHAPAAAPQLRYRVPALDVKSLSFRYPFSSEDCLSDITFTANEGEIIGITGPVGSGKSALAAALSGLYPYGGEVCVYGTPLRELHENRHEIISFMDSDQFIFSDDVSFNVTFGRRSACAGGGSDAAVAAAISLACMDGDVSSFENGMDTRLMERGVRISGGQRQRVSLARTWYAGSKILLLDDPFSAVDITMEKRIMYNIKENIGNRVVLVFSHRLSAFDMTDRIILLEKGRISQMGAHGELIDGCGLYGEIFRAQKFFERGYA